MEGSPNPGAQLSGPDGVAGPAAETYLLYEKFDGTGPVRLQQDPAGYIQVTEAMALVCGFLKEGDDAKTATEKKHAMNNKLRPVRKELLETDPQMHHTIVDKYKVKGRRQIVARAETMCKILEIFKRHEEKNAYNTSVRHESVVSWFTDKVFSEQPPKVEICCPGCRQTHVLDFGEFNHPRHVDGVERLAVWPKHRVQVSGLEAGSSVTRFELDWALVDLSTAEIVLVVEVCSTSKISAKKQHWLRTVCQFPWVEVGVNHIRANMDFAIENMQCKQGCYCPSCMRVAHQVEAPVLLGSAADGVTTNETHGTQELDELERLSGSNGSGRSGQSGGSYSQSSEATVSEEQGGQEESPFGLKRRVRDLETEVAQLKAKMGRIDRLEQLEQVVARIQRDM